MDKKREQQELRITGVSNKLRTEVKNVAAHYGISVAAFLKPKITEILSSIPDHMKQPIAK